MVQQLLLDIASLLAPRSSTLADTRLARLSSALVRIHSGRHRMSRSEAYQRVG